MGTYILKLYPLVYKLKDEDPIDIIKEHTDEEWKKLINETKDTLIYYEEYGIDIVKVERSGIFLMITYNLHPHIFKEKSKQQAQDFIRTGLMISLHSGGHPSYFKDNYENDKMIDNFVYYIFYKKK